jgi:hypothetical protein
VVLVGDDQDNTLRAAACRVEVHGNGGDDHLRVGLPFPDASFFLAGGQEKTCRLRSAVHGGLGDDVLVSRVVGIHFPGWDSDERLRFREVPVRDLLDGGEGNDTARAGRGTDTCLAEVRVDCEA